MSSKPNPAPASKIHPAALAFWLLIQLFVLILAASRFPLSARFPRTGEQYALIEMLTAQILTISLITPLLARTLSAALITIATSLPFIALAAFLSDADPTRASLAAVYVCLWIISLTLWLRVLPRAALLISAATTLLSIAGPLLWYLHAEFIAESTLVNWPRLAPLGPLAGILSLIIPTPIPRQAWLFIIIAIACPFGLLINRLALFTLRNRLEKSRAQ